MSIPNSIKKELMISGPEENDYWEQIIFQFSGFYFILNETTPWQIFHFSSAKVLTRSLTESTSIWSTNPKQYKVICTLLMCNNFLSNIFLILHSKNPLINTTMSSCWFFLILEEFTWQYSLIINKTWNHFITYIVNIEIVHLLYLKLKMLFLSILHPNVTSYIPDTELIHLCTSFGIVWNSRKYVLLTALFIIYMFRSYMLLVELNNYFCKLIFFSKFADLYFQSWS